MSGDKGGRYSPDLIEEQFDMVFNPREGELERVFTKEELIMICKKKKCVVEMDQWNPLHDFYKQLQRRGRLENKPPHKVLKLLKKLGNRYKNDPERSYSREIIEEGRLFESRTRKCFNVRWLDKIKRNSLYLSHESLSSGDSFMTVVRSQSPNNKDNQAEKHTVSTNSYRPDCNSSGTENYEGLALDTQNLQNMEDNNNGSKDSLNQLGDALEDIVESDDISNCFTQSEPVLLFQISSENYDSFHQFIPSTSTQSQEDNGQSENNEKLN